MDILIKGMEMPKDGTITIEIRHDGAVDFIGNMGSNLGRLVDVKAVALPEHGRLKDESLIIENMEKAFEKLFPMDGKHKQTLVNDCHVEFMRAVFTAPTVLEAST